MKTSSDPKSSLHAVSFPSHPPHCTLVNCSEKQYGGMGGKGKGRVQEEGEGSVSLSTSGSSNFLKFLKCLKKKK